MDSLSFGTFAIIAMDSLSFGAFAIIAMDSAIGLSLLSFGSINLSSVLFGQFVQLVHLGFIAFGIHYQY